MKNTFRQIEYNGVTFNILGLPNTDIFKLEVMFNVGSNLELEYERVFGKKIYGAMHLLEHMSFKSPLFFETNELLKLMKKYGTRNAGTSYTTLSFHQKTITEHMDFAVDAITSVAFNDLTDVTIKEFTTEKEVVMNEVKQYSDNRQLMFKLNERSRLLKNDEDDNILGSVDILEQVTLNDLVVLKNVVLSDESNRFINIIYDPDKLDNIYTLLDNIINKIDIVLPEKTMPHAFDLDAVNNRTVIRTEETDVIYQDHNCKQSIISVFVDVKENYIVRYLGDKFTSELSNEHSMFNIIREDHGLTYGVDYGKYRILDKDLTRFSLDLTPGTEELALKLFKEIVINMPKIYTEEKHNELVETLLLRDKLIVPNLFNYNSVVGKATHYQNEFSLLRDILSDDVSLIYTAEYEMFCDYEKVLSYLTNMANKVSNGDYVIIRNRNNNILTPGSFDRLKQNEEKEKGE